MTLLAALLATSRADAGPDRDCIYEIDSQANLAQLEVAHKLASVKRGAAAQSRPDSRIRRRLSSVWFGSDRLLFGLLAFALFGTILAYRRETNPEDRLRIAAAASLVAVIFLCTTFTMSWSQTDTLGQFRDGCSLGFETSCIAPAIDGTARVDLETVQVLASLVRASQVALLLLLVPALIWLLVVPVSRTAQLLTIVSVVPATVLAASTWAYYGALAPSMVRRAGAADLSLIASSMVVVTAVLTYRFAIGRRNRPIPEAIVK